MIEMTLNRPPWIEGDWHPERLIFEVNDALTGAEKSVLDSYASTHLAILARAGREGKAQYEIPVFADLMPKFFKAALVALRAIKLVDGQDIPREKYQAIMDALDIYAKEQFCLEVVKANERDLGNALDSLSS